MTQKTKMNWNDRFSIIDHFQPTDDQICNAFNVNQDELDTARTLLANGTFASNKSLDATKHSGLFNLGQQTKPTQTTHVTTPATKPTTTTHAKPETATRKVKVPQKRGRKGNNIEMALRAVSETPVPVDSFIKQHHVSLAVLRQSKRFIKELDPTIAAQIGTINVRQDKATKTLMIWRKG